MKPVESGIPKGWLLVAAALVAVTVPLGVRQGLVLGERAASLTRELGEHASAVPLEFRETGESYAAQAKALARDNEAVPPALSRAANVETRLDQTRTNQMFAWIGVGAGVVAVALLAAGAGGWVGAAWMFVAALAAVAFIVVNAAPLVVAEEQSLLTAAAHYGHFAAAVGAALACLAVLRRLEYQVHYAACCSVLGAMGLFFVWWEPPPPIPLPPQRPISELADALVPPGWEAHRVELDPIIARKLGADEYLQLALRPPDSRRELSLFVPYYSDAMSNIPHVPQVCMRGAGFGPAGHREGSLVVAAKAGKEVKLNLLAFRTPDGSSAVLMFHYLNVGWTYFRDRQRARVAATTGALGETGSYMSQTQVVIPLDPVDFENPLSEDTEAYRRGAELLQHVIPILEERYYPARSIAEDATAE